ncbi:MAG: cytidine deaminase [Chthonomonadales bacterium]|nr:cytidine deaminase [Chthonomonadales bacterium]
MNQREEHALIALAAAARRNAHAPYSGFPVGAAVVADDDRAFFGCNVENASLGLTLCAERAAIAAAVASGARRIGAVVVVTGSDKPPWPCGACLQWLAEFGDARTLVIAASVSGMVRRAELRDLIKEPFELMSTPCAGQG